MARLFSRSALPLLAGDVLVFVAFSAIGHRDHGEALGLTGIVGTALPFIGGWLLVAPWLGAYRIEPWRGAGPFLKRSAAAWLCAWPAALLLRAIVLQRGIPISFAIVALIANMVLLSGWRGVYVLLLGGARAGAAAN